MNWLVSNVFPTSEAPHMSTVYRGEQRELFRLEQGSSSSVLERRLERPEWEWLKLLEQRKGIKKSSCSHQSNFLRCFWRPKKEEQIGWQNLLSLANCYETTLQILTHFHIPGWKHQNKKYVSFSFFLWQECQIKVFIEYYCDACLFLRLLGEGLG